MKDKTKEKGNFPEAFLIFGNHHFIYTNVYEV